MRPLKTAAACLMSCLALSACTTTKRVALPVKPPAERLQCELAGTRPEIPPEVQIDWGAVMTVLQAHSLHDAYVRSVRTREGLVAGYILSVEGKLFTCANNAAWLREFFAGMPDR